MKRIAVGLFSLFLSAQSFSNIITEFNSVKQHPEKLRIFLADMPKGGDLHNHLDGAIYAEEYISFADSSMCLNPATMAIYVSEDCPVNLQLSELPKGDQALYSDLIDTWSMRDFIPGRHSGHDHAFSTFQKFAPVYNANVGDALAAVLNRAGKQHLQYLELRLPLDNAALIALGDNITWDNNLAKMQEQVVAKGVQAVVDKIPADIDTAMAQANQLMRCDSVRPTAGCGVSVRYIYPVLRAMKPVNVFSQLVGAFILADIDPRVVGIDMVMPEDSFYVLRDYKLQMEMVAYLRTQYPNVNVTLHAGELSQGSVVPYGLDTHINQAVSIAGAQRIGHGVDIAYEDDAEALLEKMAKRHVAVEINLSSNEKILGVSGDDHPFALYLDSGVPMAISTDDEGVLRTDMSNELFRAVTTYDLSYAQLKQLIRNSLTYSFLAGDSLWENAETATPISVCAESSEACNAFLKGSDKARLQWALEERFTEFELKH